MELIKFVPSFYHQFYEDLKNVIGSQAPIPGQVIEGVNKIVDIIYTDGHE